MYTVSSASAEPRQTIAAAGPAAGQRYPNLARTPAAADQIAEIRMFSEPREQGSDTRLIEMNLTRPPIEQSRANDLHYNLPQ